MSKFKTTMDVFKNTALSIGSTTGKVVDSACKKAGEVANVTKLNIEVYDLESEIETLYKEIGKNIYIANTGGEVDADEVPSKIDLITKKMSRIEEVNRLKEEMKTAGMPKCTTCGKVSEEDATFCKDCGAQL